MMMMMTMIIIIIIIGFYLGYLCKLIVVKILHGLQVIVLRRERVSKQFTNGSKTAVMEVIGFLCVSLCSSRIQRHDSLGSRRACARSGLVLLVKMATVLEEYRKSEFLCAFLSVSERTQCEGYS
jgi:D-alanyl-lipoteichoic acid acyltransferase DltB (MBOAT superfamily)